MTVIIDQFLLSGHFDVHVTDSTGEIIDFYTQQGFSTLKEAMDYINDSLLSEFRSSIVDIKVKEYNE